MTSFHNVELLRTESWDSELADDSEEGLCSGGGLLLAGSSSRRRACRGWPPLLTGTLATAGVVMGLAAVGQLLSLTGAWESAASSAAPGGASGHVVAAEGAQVLEAGPSFGLGLLQGAGQRHQRGTSADLPGAQAGVDLGSGISRHWALPCWDACAGAGLCEHWCGPGRSCCKYRNASDPPACRGVGVWPVLTFHTCVTGSFDTQRTGVVAQGASAGNAPVHRFYVYRAQSDARYPIGNVNVGNLAGTMWYLTNEVMPRCPKRYGISRVKRAIITTQATPDLFARGMNFGLRYSFDHGECTGSNTRNLGPCRLTWDRFGHVPGCNNFKDHYPYPLIDTAYPDGIWYSLPNAGKCDHPTGAWNCTWSVEDAGEVNITELEASVPGYNYCCHGNCTGFWRHPHSKSQGADRVQQALQVFKSKYPSMPRELPDPPCDFDRSQFWAS